MLFGAQPASCGFCTFNHRPSPLRPQTWRVLDRRRPTTVRMQDQPPQAPPSAGTSSLLQLKTRRPRRQHRLKRIVWLGEEPQASTNTAADDASAEAAPVDHRRNATREQPIPTTPYSSTSTSSSSSVATIEGFRGFPLRSRHELERMALQPLPNLPADTQHKAVQLRPGLTIEFYDNRSVAFGTIAELRNSTRSLAVVVDVPLVEEGSDRDDAASIERRVIDVGQISDCWSDVPGAVDWASIHRKASQLMGSLAPEWTLSTVWRRLFRNPSIGRPEAKRLTSSELAGLIWHSPIDTVGDTTSLCALRVATAMMVQREPHTFRRVASRLIVSEEGNVTTVYIGGWKALDEATAAIREVQAAVSYVRSCQEAESSGTGSGSSTLPSDPAVLALLRQLELFVIANGAANGSDDDDTAAEETTPAAKQGAPFKVRELLKRLKKPVTAAGGVDVLEMAGWWIPDADADKTDTDTDAGTQSPESRKRLSARFLSDEVMHEMRAAIERQRDLWARWYEGQPTVRDGMVDVPLENFGLMDGKADTDGPSAPPLRCRDYRHLRCYAVDSQRASFYDDCVAIDPATRDVLVFICDPDRFIVHGSELDLLARRRLKTIYFNSQLSIHMLPNSLLREAALQSHAAVDKTGRPPINPVIGASLREGAVFPAVIGPITPVTFARAYDVDDVAAVAGELGMDLGGSDGERMAQQMVGRALLRFSEKSRAFVKDKGLFLPTSELEPWRGVTGGKQERQRRFATRPLRSYVSLLQLRQLKRALVPSDQDGPRPLTQDDVDMRAR
ncbi:unnamed protein product [Vitrella brassicaformis CCMP3155]|uniref:RNB domain-containing protein n=3 Tax=Vitrella brassicaformis TaxID=1169539 RepID=A0A0G4GGR7_VITBC|nr:unnamed protein product [Vitrella brassicaformis CCMP3155]|eukprot:CEM28840.1 unnamed protein product [Vitrella brassicaformis CCMP3155]